MTRTTNLVARLPAIARRLQNCGRFGRRLAFSMMNGRCSVCGVRVEGWKPGDFYACDEHLEQVRERWITAIAYQAANAEPRLTVTKPTAAVQPAATAAPDYEKARGCAPSLNGLSPEDAIRRGR